MRSLLLRLASLKVSVALLTAILVALAVGTIVESAHGTAAAGRTVYYALWFQLLLGAFAVNVVASIATHFPWGRWRAGFLMTHTALVVILAGSLVSYFFKVEGHLPIWEGEENAVFVEPAPRAGAPDVEHRLPFTVRLDDFQIDTYQGTRRPAMFRSKVHVVDAETGRTFPAVIQMNQPLTYRGYSLFQSSYEMGHGRERTILAVSKDPGEGVVFFGYTLLLVGLTTVLATRMIQARARARATAGAGALGAVRRVAVFAFAALAAAGVGAPARAAGPDDATVETIRRLPVQHDGRVMPFDTVAREAVRAVTGRRSWHGEDPVRTALAWSFDPIRWRDEPVVAIGSRDLATACGFPSGTTHASFLALVRNRTAMDLLDRARAEGRAGRPVRRVLADAQKLEGRLVTMQEFLQGNAWAVLPDAADPSAAWTVPHVATEADLAALARRNPSGAPAAAMEREIRYNAVRPTRIAWIVLAVSLLASILAAGGKRRWLDVLALTGLVAGFAVMTWGIATRWAIAGRIPASNMYESLLFLAWGVGAFALLAFGILRNRLVVVNATAMAALTMALTDLLPIDGFIHPVAPVLSGTPWLAIHVPIIMVSYSVLALGVVIAHMQIGLTIVRPRKREAIARMSDLLYWYILVGSILLVAGIITGSIWASGSWGRYWGWDPKEVWSLVAFLAYMAILHGRVERIVGSFGVAAISIVAFQTILMTYLGVNFVLTTGMHSYAFGDSPVVGWMALVAGLEAAFLAAGYVAYRRSASPLGTAAAG